MTTSVILAIAVLAMAAATTFPPFSAEAMRIEVHSEDLGKEDLFKEAHAFYDDGRSHRKSNHIREEKKKPGHSSSSTRGKMKKSNIVRVNGQDGPWTPIPPIPPSPAPTPVPVTQAPPPSPSPYVPPTGLTPIPPLEPTTTPSGYTTPQPTPVPTTTTTIEPTPIPPVPNPTITLPTTTPHAPFTPAPPTDTPIPDTPAPPTPVPTSHTFTFINNCSEDIWIGTLSNPGYALIANGGFLMEDRAEPVSVQVPVGWQGRFWARIACNFTAEGVCDPPYQPCCASGSCLNAEGKFGIHCAHAGLPPNSLVELSLDNTSPYGPYDVYDVSLVDGWSVPLSIEPVNNTFNPNPDPGVTAPWCELSGCEAAPPCPSNLAVSGTTVSCWSPCQQAVNQNKGKDYTERVCCVCTLAHPSCDCASTNNPNSGDYGCCNGGYGCTPFHTPAYAKDTVCNPWANNGRGWPADDLKYINVIEKVCNKVYTWQFDDKAATFMCRKTSGLVDYNVRFVTLFRENSEEPEESPRISNGP